MYIYGGESFGDPASLQFNPRPLPAAEPGSSRGVLVPGSPLFEEITDASPRR
jgi:hypothetical protein